MHISRKARFILLFNYNQKYQINMYLQTDKYINKYLVTYERCLSAIYKNDI